LTFFALHEPYAAPMFFRQLRPNFSATVMAILFAFTIGANAASKIERKEPAFATSVDDPVLINTIANLAQPVKTEEARRVAECAYNTGRDLKREWKVVWPPGLQNFLVNTGQRKGGLCFQFATELLIRLDKLKLQTIELHWAESFIQTLSEHNVIVVTAKGQPFEQGIILDNWRYGGRLVWGQVLADPHYQWRENKAEIPKRLKASQDRLTTEGTVSKAR
jgi:hypothetical protein